MEYRDKRELRKVMLAARNGIDPADRAYMDERLYNRLIGFDKVRDAGCILAYASYGSEADTHRLINYLLQQKKKVALPRVSGEEMDFYLIEDMDDLCPGYKGIPEPRECCTRYEPEDKDVIIVPGTAFDRKLFRMGYGKGYYDRYLSAHGGLYSVGLAYYLQITDSVPVDEWDRGLDTIITDKEIII